MSETAAPAPGSAAEQALRADLARADAQAGTVAPILRHLFANDDHALFGDALIAQVRGMLGDLARQLSEAIAEGDGVDASAAGQLRSALADVPGLLGHLHALALEWQLTERLQAHNALDPVVPPLLQALVASSDAATSGLAMNLLAAQARFTQAQRRMRLPLSELPADLLHGALLALRSVTVDQLERAQLAEEAVRKAYDEGRTRLGLIARVATGLGGGAIAALALSHAGVAIFSTALALATGQDRDRVVLSTAEGQLARLVLALRAAGLKPASIAEQIDLLRPHAGLPTGFAELATDRAAALLVAAQGA